jgi:hypothetical protein
MKLLVALALTLFCGAAWSAPSQKATADNGVSLVLHDTQGHCPPDRLEAYMHNPDASVLFRGCWTGLMTPRGPAVHVLWDDGDMSLVPAQAFKPVSSV